MCALVVLRRKARKETYKPDLVLVRRCADGIDPVLKASPCYQVHDDSVIAERNVSDVRGSDSFSNLLSFFAVDVFARDSVLESLGTFALVV
jgi:hypothetical protein